ncbi:Predicted arabinose efflux permease, MFS family [Friedmanniella luteola]|uniref:Predicted arabinose efflux permease, MFS family n=1 Tax=Friedmanniella luteola TaxID=546871 RepID=A0A1H1RUG0_9ACTN|nr:MFS transporter [Friedmanniella luteola]SDS38649.1 Predicted arabinose efflux permease, MFS family [Friedmanniella luteola]
MARRTRDALAPGFARFWWGEAVSGFGSGITLLALQTLVVVTLGGTAVEVGWLNAARWLPYLVLGLVVGALVDRVRRRPVMVASDLARAGLLALVPLAWSADRLTFALLLPVVVLVGTASLVNDAASQSYLPRLVPAAQLQRAHARLDGAGAVAQAAGPAVAGALVRVIGAPLAVLVDALTFLFSAAVVATLPRESGSAPVPSTARGRGRLVGEVREGVRWVYRDSGLARLAAATHVWFAAQAVLLVALPAYAFLQLQLSALQLGLVLAVGGVGALAGAVLSTAVGHRLGTGGTIICSHAASAVGVGVMIAAALPASGWAAAAVLATGQLGHGWAMGLSNSHEMSYRQALTPDALQARTNTTLRSLNRAVVVVVSPVAGLVADRLGFEVALGVSALVFALSTLLLALSPFRRVRMT